MTGAALGGRYFCTGKVVSERAGHANVNITLNTYAAYIPNMQADAAMRVNAWLR